MYSPGLNFVLLLIAFVGLAFTYLLSLYPKKREAKIGMKAWKQSKHLRTVGFLFESLGIFTLLAWNWVPLASVDWKIHINPVVGLIIALTLGTPLSLIFIIGLIHAGKESWEPSENTVLHRGIYAYIRHPQAIAEFPLFIVIGIGVNSWFLVLIMSIYNLIFLPLMKVIEERDLIRRFGDSYRTYQQTTGAFFPKRKKR